MDSSMESILEDDKDQDGRGDGDQPLEHRVKTKAEIRAEKELKAAEKIRLATGINRVKKSTADDARLGEYFITLVPCTDEGVELPGGYPRGKFLAAYNELKERHPLSHAKVTSKGYIEVWTNSVMENTKAASITTLGGIHVKVLAHKGQIIWGRVSGVFHQFEEAELMDFLENQGALEVKREVYTVTNPATGQPMKRNSNRIRIKFQGIPPKEINLGFQVFPVTICPPSPQQCYSCFLFGHKSSTCTRPKVCRKCGKAGHMEKDCKGKAACVNCRREHSARDPKCPVYQQRAEAQRSRLVCHLATPGTEVVEMPVLTKENTPPVASEEGGSLTFAQVVKAGSKVILGADSKVKAVIPPVKPPKAKKVVKKIVAPKKPPKAKTAAAASLLEVLRPLLRELVGKKTMNIVLNILKARMPR